MIDANLVAGNNEYLYVRNLLLCTRREEDVFKLSLKIGTSEFVPTCQVPETQTICAGCRATLNSYWSADPLIF